MCHNNSNENSYLMSLHHHLAQSLIICHIYVYDRVREVIITHTCSIVLSFVLVVAMFQCLLLTSFELLQVKILLIPGNKYRLKEKAQSFNI